MIFFFLLYNFYCHKIHENIQISYKKENKNKSKEDNNDYYSLSNIIFKLLKNVIAVSVL